MRIWKPFIASALVISLLHLSNALEPTQTYARGPIALSSVIDFWYDIDFEGESASLAVRVTDTDVVVGTAPANWIGLGVSEPTSGGMLGADVVTAEFARDAVNECTLTDRYVPFVPFPLLETTNGAPSAFPERDDCQDGWTLVSCARDVETGQIVLEVIRPLAANDDQDRELGPGQQAIISAYGTRFEYHQSRRTSRLISLYDEDGTILDPDNEIALPDDISATQMIIATNYTVPGNKDTIYACTAIEADLGPNGRRMVVAAEPILESTDKEGVHHLVLYACTGEEYANLWMETGECTTLESGSQGPLGNPNSGCQSLVYGYAKGIGRFVFPNEAGFLLTERNRFLVLEAHYNNPDLVSGVVDQSGVKLHYADELRENEAGTLLVGDGLLQRFQQQVMNGFEYENECPSECTGKFNTSINVFGSFLHMHRTGQEIYTNRFQENETFIENLSRVNFWSDNFQQVVSFDPPKQIAPGERLITTCKYDTTKLPETTFGASTADEMCLEFISYWPLQRDPETNEEINLCSFTFDQESGNTSALCGDIGNVSTVQMIPGPNPSFVDTINAPTDFGRAGTCPVDTGLPLPSMTDEPEPGNGSEEADDGDGEDDACFPASATVVLQDGSRRRMDEIAVGDMVQAGAGEYSAVFMFTHQDSGRTFPFVRIETASGRVLHATRGHYIYANQRLVTAGSVQKGDVMWGGDGNADVVEKVGTVKLAGLYNPQTVHGNIVVDDVLCSTYTESVEHGAAHALLAPLRWAWRIAGIDASFMTV